MGMRLGKAIEFVKEGAMRGLFRKRVVFMLGKPGVGKTERITQVAKEIAKEKGLQFIKYSEVARNEQLFEEVVSNREKYFIFKEIRMSETMPEDFGGIPKKEDGYARYVPLHWAYVLSGGPGMLFIDEANLLFREEKKAVMYKILEKKVGDVELHEECIVVCAGNPPTVVDLAEELPSPVANRVIFLRVEASIKEWLEWAERNAVHPVVVEFLKKYPEEFEATEVPGETLEQFATPRSWEILSDVLKVIDEMNLAPEEITEIIAGTVGRKVAAKFTTFYLSMRPKSIDVNWKELDIPGKKEYIRTVLAMRDANKAWEKLREVLQSAEGSEIIFTVVYETTKKGVKSVSKAVFDKIVSEADKGDELANRMIDILRRVTVTVVREREQ